MKKFHQPFLVISLLARHNKEALIWKKCHLFIFFYLSLSYHLTGQMAKSEDSGFYTGSLLTLNANSSDEYVKGIYDEWAEKYDKVLPLSSFQKL